MGLSVSMHEAYESACVTPRWTTYDSTLMAKFEQYDVHGGPPVVYVPAKLSATGKPYYLGIMHHIER